MWGGRRSSGSLCECGVTVTAMALVCRFSKLLAPKRAAAKPVGMEAVLKEEQPLDLERKRNKKRAMKFGLSLASKIRENPVLSALTPDGVDECWRAIEVVSSVRQLKWNDTQKGTSLGIMSKHFKQR